MIARDFPMPAEETVEELEALLDTSTLEGRFRMLEYLGTSDSIAEFFRYKGIAGRMKASGKCPMSLYLSAEKPGRVVVRPTSLGLLVRTVNSYVANYEGGQRERHLVSGACRFVERFDNREYPDLIY